MTGNTRLCCHGIQTSMEAILACHTALSTLPLCWSGSFVWAIWRIRVRTGPIWRACLQVCLRKVIPKTIGNRKRGCAWGCAREIIYHLRKSADRKAQISLVSGTEWMSDQSQPCAVSRNAEICIEGEDWIPAGRLFRKISARGKNEHDEVNKHNDDDLVTRGTR